MPEFVVEDCIDDPIHFTDIFSSKKILQYCGKFACVVVITDENVGAHYAAKLLKHFSVAQINSHLITIPPGELSKSRDMKNHIEDEMFSLKCGRNTLMVALGGGVVTDLTGFVAATYYRGIPVIYMPTSLLAMVDAAIGGKTGINTGHGKNLIGTFTHPRAIFVDVTLLDTLPESEYILAFSEVIKHALIADANYFSFLEKNISALLRRDHQILTWVIKRSCEIKSAVVLEDHKEESKREVLNFGHTIAHALETASQYAISHGQAVAVGIMVECYLSQQMALLSQFDFQRIKQLMENCNIPLKINAKFSEEEFVNALGMDKKNRKTKNATAHPSSRGLTAGSSRSCWWKGPWIPRPSRGMTAREGEPLAKNDNFLENRFIVLTKIGAVRCVEGSYAQHVDRLLLQRAIDYLFSQYVS